jgi:hypothetical protein
MVLYQCNWANVDVIMIDSLFAGKVSPFAGKKINPPFSVTIPGAGSFHCYKTYKSQLLELTDG